MSKIIIPLFALGFLSGCATLGEVTAEERAHCVAMADKMGTDQQHSHAEEKGTIAKTPMNQEHARCQAILSQAPKT